MSPFQVKASRMQNWSCKFTKFNDLATLLFGPDQIAHWRHIGGVAGECQAAEIPAILNRCQHGLMIVGDVRRTRRLIRVRNSNHDDAAAAFAGNGVAASAVVPETAEAAAGEIGLIP